MHLALLGAKRQLGCPVDHLCVGKPHGAEGGFDPYVAYKDLDDDNFYQYLCGRILGADETTEWVRGGSLIVRRGCGGGETRKRTWLRPKLRVG